MLTAREQAFGLVELIVAGFITLVVIAAFAAMFSQAFGTNSAIDAKSISSARLNDALDRIGDDLRATRSAGRGDISVISTKDDLRTRMNADPEAYGDVAWAAGRQFAVWTDGLPGTDGPRCATYALEQVQEVTTEWALVRRMTMSGQPCPAAAGSVREVIALLGAAAPAADAFRYNVLAPTGPQACRVTTVAAGAGTLDARQRLRIVGIDIDLASINTRRGRERSSAGRGSIDLWSRLNDDYYYAVGCAQ